MPYANTINAGTGNVSLTVTTGALVDGNGASLNVTANALTVNAATGIGQTFCVLVALAVAASLGVFSLQGLDREVFVRAEARFALWDMQVRERRLDDAIVSARALARDFPENHELSRFIQTNNR